MATQWYGGTEPDRSWAVSDSEGARLYAAEQERLRKLRAQGTQGSVQAMSDAQQQLDESRSRQYNSLPKPGAAMPTARLNQFGDDYINSINGQTVGANRAEGDRILASLLDNPDNLNPQLDAAGARQLQMAQEAQRAFMAQQGIQGKQDNQAMKATQNLLANPGMHFGQGGGDWASAWSKAMQPQRGIFESIVGNQLGSFLDYGKGLNQIFNSATGPYGQMQAAAVATAPSRAQRDISKDKLGVLSGLFEQMGANRTPSVSSVETDYGAYAKMLPSLMKKYLPGG